ncbi:hypothetical protein BH23VER1_BH23VER1_23610 [soil metagenome]
MAKKKAASHHGPLPREHRSSRISTSGTPNPPPGADPDGAGGAVAPGDDHPDPGAHGKDAALSNPEPASPSPKPKPLQAPPRSRADALDLSDIEAELSAASDTPDDGVPGVGEPEMKAAEPAPPEPARTPDPAVAGAPEKVAAPAQPSDPEEVHTRKKGLRVWEIAGLAGVGAILIALLVFLFKLSADIGGDRGAAPAAIPPASAAGELVTFSDIAVQWRTKAARSGRQAGPEVVPEFSADVAGVAGHDTAFIKIHFINGEGKISGDVRSAKVEGGKLVDSGKGETVIDGRRLVVTASRGFGNETEYLSYKFSEDPRWTVEVFEGADYATGPWSRIAYFEMTGVLSQEQQETPTVSR